MAKSARQNDDEFLSLCANKFANDLNGLMNQTFKSYPLHRSNLVQVSVRSILMVMWINLIRERGFGPLDAVCIMAESWKSMDEIREGGEEEDDD